MKLRLDPFSPSGVSFERPQSPVITGSSSSSSGGGAVASVNGYTGVVVLTAQDVLPTQTGNGGKFLTTNGTIASWASIPGGGDMLASVYDPNAIASDAFAMENMEQGTTKLYVSTGSQTFAGAKSFSSQVGMSAGFIAAAKSYLFSTTGTAGQGLNIVSSSDGLPLTTYQALDTGGISFAFFAVNKYYTGSGWADMGHSRVGSSFQLVDDSFTFFTFNTGTTFTARFSVNTTGVTVNDALTIGTLSGVLKASSGLVSVATAGTDYTTPSSTETVTNKNLTSGTNTFPTFNQSTTGSAATLTTPRAIYGNNFDGSAALAQIITSVYGGTGNGFTKFTGAASTEKTYTLPNASATILTDNAAVTVAQGGTGLTSAFTAGSIVFSNGTTFAQDNTGLFYDDTNNRLGLGITSPSQAIHVFSATASQAIRVESQLTSGLARIQLFNDAGKIISYSVNGSATANTNLTNVPSSGLIQSTGAGGLSINSSDASGFISFSTGGIATGNERMKIISTGAVKLNAYGSGTFTGTATKTLQVDASGNIIEGSLAGTGTVTASGGALTANAIVLGAGTTDTKVAAGIITDGTSVITLGVNTTTIGKLKLFGNTSGDATIQPAAVAGTATVLTLPAATGTLATLAGTETFTNKDLTSGTNTFPTFNQNTTGSAAKWTTARLLAGNSVDGSANVAFANKFIVQGTTDTGLTGAQFLGALGTGLVKNTTSTGVLSIAAQGTDYYAPGGTKVAVADGGTGVGTLTGVLKGNGTSAITGGAVLNDVGAATGDYSLNSHKLTSVTDPTSAQDAATKAYVDSVVASTDYKDASVYATTAALPTLVYNNGSSGVGATLTGVSVGALSVDSNTPSVGDRILVKDQASAFQNGIYTVTTVGSGIAVFVLTRATDFDQSADIDAGDATYVLSGTVNAGRSYVLTTTGTVTVGTTNLSFSLVSGPGSILAGTGISVTGLTVSIDTAVTVDKTTAQTLTNKTLTTPIIASISNTGTLTLPTSTDTLIGKATTDTLTNKTYDTAGTGNVFKINGTTITANTGTGSNVLATTPTLVTPVLGVATATSINGLAITTTTGTLTMTNAKTLAVTNSLTLSGTDSTTMTFPTTSGNVIASATAIGTVSGTPSSANFLRGDGTWAAPAGGGTVTASGGSLTANAIVLGAGTTDTKVVAGIITDGTSQITLGVNTTTLGKLKMFGNTSGDATIQPAAIAGTATVLTLPAVTGTLATLAGTETFTNKTLTSPTMTTPTLGVASATTINKVTITAPATGSTLTVADGKTFIVNNGLTLSGTDSTVMTFPSTTATIARTDAAQTFTGVQTLSSAPVLSTGTVTVSGSTVTFPTSADTLVARATTDTLTNKRITPRIGTTTSSGTPTINTDNVDQYNITALAANITSMTTNLSGTPTSGQKLMLRFKDNGTARTITWGTSFQSSGIATLLATTVISKVHHVLLIWDDVASKWTCMAVDTAGY